MRTNTTKRFILVGAVLGAALGLAGTAVAADAPSGARQTGSASGTTSGPNTNVEIQRGIVMEGTGVAGDLSATVTVYENSLHGNSIQVIIGDPDDGRIGYVEQAEPFVVDGVLHATVEIDGQTAELSGSVAQTGRPTKVMEPIQDSGEQLITRGTHTQLLANVTITCAGTSIPLEFAPAFAYDLEIRRVTLYGN
jgi:hypothetical protein